MIEEYAALCDDAANHTDAKVAYEIMPFDPNVGTLEAGLRLVTEADRPNGGLAIDTWHMGKLRRRPRASWQRSPPSTSAGSSCPTDSCEYMEDKLDEVINHRELPGEGEFDIPGYVTALHRGRLPRAVGRRDPVREASQPADRAGIRPCL